MIATTIKLEVPGYKITPMGMSYALIFSELFSREEIMEIAEYLQVYCSNCADFDDILLNKEPPEKERKT